MPAPRKTARSAPKSKASRPDLQPLDEHLAALLNPALVKPRPPGFGEAPQAKFESPAPESHPRGMTGAAATVDSLKVLLEQGDPNIRERPPWTPHRPPRPEKSEGGRPLRVVSEFEPEGDQPQAIEELVKGVRSHERDQVLLGVTGSGKTFTMAKVIEATQRPALILAPNKTLAAQLYGEFRSFFPDNAVEYFVSYYDYYQPEAYVPRTDTYIEKESSINEQIDRMRHAATRAVLERDDVIIVASVSCIYGIGSVETYTAMTFSLKLGETINQRQLISDLVALQYKRSQADFARGLFRVRGDTIELFPALLRNRLSGDRRHEPVRRIGNDLRQGGRNDPDRRRAQRPRARERLLLHPADRDRRHHRAGGGLRHLRQVPAQEGVRRSASEVSHE